MSYFDYFREVQYTFGSNTLPVAFQDLSVYADLIDQLSDQASYYSYYTILEGDRPDILADKLYGNSQYGWVFFLLNDHLRESGWPLTRQELNTHVDEMNPGCCITTREEFSGSIAQGTNIPGPLLRVGDTLTGSVSATSGVVTKLDPDNGQVFMNVNAAWNAGEEVTWRDDDNALQSFTIESCVDYELATDHYEDVDGNHVDIDPAVGPGVLLLEVTIKDMYERRNEELKQIRIIRPDYIDTIVNNVHAALEG